jgi:MSHA biogenesis protein MshI
MWSVFKRIESSRGRIGVFSSDDGIAIAEVISAPHEHRPRLMHCTLEAPEPDALTRAARHLSKRRLPLVSVLPASSYHMLLVEAPDVPQDELRAAVRWRIKDLIDFHIDDAVIDVFQMPQQSRGGPNQMMYAIAARAEHVREQITAAEEAGLNLEVIDIFELALRNVAVLLEQDAEGLALLYLHESSGVLLLVRQGVLYLTRRIETSAQMLSGAGGLRSELIAGLALETRRSLDYFESHYEQSPISAVHTMGLSPSDLDQLGSELGLSARHINPLELFDTEVELDEAQQRRCLPAIGAALRHDRVTL